MERLSAAMMVGVLTVALAGCSPEVEDPVVESETTFAEGGTGFASEDEEGLTAQPAEVGTDVPPPPQAAPGTAPPAAAPTARQVEEAAPSRSEPAPRQEPATPSPSRTTAAPTPAAPVPAAPPAAAPSPAPAAASASGRELFLEQNCQRCHAVSAAGIEAKVTTGRTAGGDLSASTLDRAALSAVALREREVDDRRHPGQFKGTPDELETLVDWLITQRR
jgi:hypothetical protein